VAEDFEVLKAVVEEKLYRIYELSPWLSLDEVLKKHLKKVGGRFKKRPELLKELLTLTDGGKTVLEISKELRMKGFRVSPEDIFEIYERYRRKGIVRMKTIGVVEVAPKPEVYMKTTIVPAEEIVEKLRSLPEASKTEALKQELDKLLSTIEEQELPVAEEVVKPPPIVPRRKVAEDVIKIRMSGIMDNLFKIDAWIDVVMLATSEGDPIVFFSRMAEVPINQANLAAASAVIFSVSKTGSESFKKGRVKEILILARRGYILLKPITDTYIMIALINKGASLGIALRDLSWISKELETLIGLEAKKELIK